MSKYKYLVGKCTKMCSDEELKIRRKQKMIDRFESVGEEDRQADRKPDPNKMVKKYFRIGVSTEPTISDLRTPETLENTINYLLTEILEREDREFHEIYNFVFDRLKAVKQDMVVQNLSKMYYITFYQPMVKFYAYAFYRLCDAPDDLFEPTLHAKEFIETLKVLLGLYSKYDAFCSDPETGVKTNLDIYNAFKKERPLMECFYLLCTIGPIAMRRSLNLEEEYRTPLVKKCYRIVRELNNNNFAVFENEVKELPPLLAAIAASHMPKIRGTAFDVFRKAYKSKNNPYPTEEFKKLLLYNNIKDVLGDCYYYNVRADAESIFFSEISSQYPSYSTFFVFQHDCAVSSLPLSLHCSSIHHDERNDASSRRCFSRLEIFNRHPYRPAANGKRIVETT